MGYGSRHAQQKHEEVTDAGEHLAELENSASLASRQLEDEKARRSAIEAQLRRTTEILAQAEARPEEALPAPGMHSREAQFIDSRQRGMCSCGKYCTYFGKKAAHIRRHVESLSLE